MEGGVLHIAVLAGKLAALHVDDANRLSDARVKFWFANLMYTAEALIRILLLLGDAPGNGRVSAQPELDASVGESVMNLQVEVTAAWSGRKGHQGSLERNAAVAWRGDHVGMAEADKPPRTWMQLGWEF